VLKSPTGRWTAAGIAVCGLLSFAAWFYVVSPQRDQAGAAWEEVEAAQSQTLALRSRVTVLKNRFEGVAAARAALVDKRESLPAASELDTLVLALDEAGSQTGVTIDAVLPGPPEDITPVPTSDDEDDEDGDEDDDEEESGDRPEPTATVAPWPMFVLPVTVRATGSSSDVMEFLRVVQLEQPRAILVVSFTIAPSLDAEAVGDRVTLTAVTNVFVSPVRVPGSSTSTD
jgi:Tfp pilus assembly protein PilO